jgi:hypothetical protein
MIMEKPSPSGTAKTNPIKPNFKIGKMNATFFPTKPYANEQQTMNNERSLKTNPIKPNFKHRACALTG